MMETFSGATGYLWVAFVALVFVVGSSIFGGHDVTDLHDTSHGGGADGDSGPSVLSIRNIAMFFLGFGATGALVVIKTGSQTYALIGGCAVGLLMSAIVYYVSRVFYRQQSTTESSVGNLIGKDAQVVIDISPGITGQITMADRYGTPTIFPAISGDNKTHREGTVVKVQSFSGITASIKAV